MVSEAVPSGSGPARARVAGSSRPGERMRVAVLATVVAAAALLAFVVIQPMNGAPLAYDTASSVLHFERIVGGHPLVESLGTTPKPILTLVYGLVHRFAGGWLGVSLTSIAAWAVTVALGAALAWRRGGAIAAAALVAALLVSRTMLLETAWGLGSVWALGLWFAAGLAATADRPRWALSGVLLAAATLARLETVLVIGLAFVVLLARRLGPKPIRGPVPAGAWWLALGLVAFPIMLAHDWLLTGNPLYWTTVSAAYSEGAAAAHRLPTVVDVVRSLARLARGMPITTLLALVGVVRLAVRRDVVLLVAVAALGPGMAAFLLVLAARHLFVDPRYLIPIELALDVCAAVALGWILAPDVLARTTRRLRRLPEPPSIGIARWMSLASGALAVAVAIAAAPVIGPLDAATKSQIAATRALGRTADRATGILRPVVAAIPGALSWPGSAPLPLVGTKALLVVPTPIRPRLAVDLGLPLSRVGSTAAAALDPTGSTPAVGQILVHSSTEAPAAKFAPFQVSVPTIVGLRLLVPLLADPADGIWVIRVDAAGG